MARGMIRRGGGPRIVAVTGGVGKTTTTWLVASVLAEAGLRVGIVSDLGCVDADGSLAPPPETTGPDALASRIATLADGGCTHAVVEAPLEAIEAGVPAPGTCAAVVVTGPPGDAGAAWGAAARRVVGRLPAGGCLVAASSMGLAPLFAAATRRPHVTCLTAGLDDACDVSARPVERGLHGQTFLVSAGGAVAPVAVDVPVASFARNATCAAAAGLALGVPLEVAVRGIEAAGCVAGRVERLDRGQDFAAFLDTPPCGRALASTLASLRRLTPGRLAVVAEQSLVDRLGAAFAGPVRRRCDDAIVVPSRVLDADADEAALAAYARIDRLLGRLGDRDCLLVLGATGAGAGGRPDTSGVPLATLIDGWLRLAHPPRRAQPGRRRAA